MSAPWAEPGLTVEERTAAVYAGFPRIGPASRPREIIAAALRAAIEDAARLVEAQEHDKDAHAHCQYDAGWSDALDQAAAGIRRLGRAGS